MARSRRTTRRTKPEREPYDRVLIVTEGEKTEPLYFRGLIAAHRINTANVEVSPSTLGSDPFSIVETAVRIRDEESSLGEQYDRVYCVFDKDSHTNFDDASKRARSEDIRLARSWPCFEYWILLHFTYMRSPFQRTHNRSPCDNCISTLRQHIPDYLKTTIGIFDRLTPNLESAIEHAKQALNDAHSTGSNDPSTEVHLLVEYLQNVKSK